MQGDGFSLAAPPPSGQSLQPQQAGEFTVVFQPAVSRLPPGHSSHRRSARYPLAGTCHRPAAAGAPPSPYFFSPPPARSREPWSSASTLPHRPLAPEPRRSISAVRADAAIAFAAGGRTVNFSVAPGDTQIRPALPDRNHRRNPYLYRAAGADHRAAERHYRSRSGRHQLDAKACAPPEPSKSA